jgi:hypothetical protein
MFSLTISNFTVEKLMIQNILSSLYTIATYTDSGESDLSEIKI